MKLYFIKDLNHNDPVFAVKPTKEEAAAVIQRYRKVLIDPWIFEYDTDDTPILADDEDIYLVEYYAPNNVYAHKCLPNLYEKINYVERGSHIKDLLRVRVVAKNQTEAIRKAVRMIDPSVKEVVPPFDTDEIKKFVDKRDGSIVKFGELPIGSVFRYNSKTIGVKEHAKGGHAYYCDDFDVGSFVEVWDPDQLVTLLGSFRLYI